MRNRATTGWKLLLKLLLPPSAGGWFGFFFGTLSIVALLQSALSIGVGPTLMLVLENYERATSIVFGWAEPFVTPLVDAIGGWLHVDLVLHPHWKHVFVLLGVYFFRDVTETFRVRRPASGVFLFVTGLAVGAFASLGAGATPLDPNDWLSNFLISALPVLGVTLYDFGKLVWYATFLRVWTAERYNEPLQGWWPYFRDRSHYVARVLAVGLAAALFGQYLPVVQASANPGLTILTILVGALAIYWLALGASRAAGARRHDETWDQAFERNGATLLGAAMLRIVVGAAAFFASNTGFALLGL